MLIGDLILGIISALIAFLFLARVPREKETFKILLWGFIVRLIILFVDYYKIYIFPGSGADTEFFDEMARNNQTDSEAFYSTNYEIYLTIVYAFTGCSRLFAQYLNVIMGMLFLLYLNKTLLIANVCSKTRLLILRIASFMPNLIIFSAILLREAWIEMFIMISLYYYVKWFVRKKWSCAIASLACVMAASWMHGACIIVSIGYVLSFVIFDRKKNMIRMTKSTLGTMMLVVLFILLLFHNSSTFMGKLGVVNDAQFSELMVDLYTPTVDAGSLYLQWLTISSPIQGLLFSPLKMFYFLFSPIPFDWRGIPDVIAFFFDSCIYLFLSLGLCQWKNNSPQHKYLFLFLMLSFLITTFVFSFGTAAAGTAVRHRAKYVSLLFVSYALCRADVRNIKKMYKNVCDCRKSEL